MKKSIATIALFALALVTTSFTTVEASNNLSNTISVDPPTGGTGGTGGQSTGDGRKLDIYSINEQSVNNFYQTGSFYTERQSAIASRKMD